MRMIRAGLCALVVVCLAQAGLAEGWHTYTGSLGFTLSVPEDWLSVLDDDDDPPQPGEPEAMFLSMDGRASLSVLRADGADRDPALMSEAAMEAHCAGFPAYQKQLYQADTDLERALLAYTYQESGQPQIEYMVAFISASDVVQVFTVTLDADAQELLPVVAQIINSLDVGALSDGAEG
jgi:hypothetical protein